MNTNMNMNQNQLIWKMMDPEEKLGFHGKKYTSVNNLFSLILGFVLTLFFYGVLYPFHLVGKYPMVDMFFHGGPENRSAIPYFTVLLSGWCLAFLFIKWRKLVIQRKALLYRLIPEGHDFVISQMNVQELLDKMHGEVLFTSNFMLLWRIDCALSNLRNIGRIADVSSFLSDLAKTDSEFVENSYTLPKGLIWAIPVLGFIGTVLGLAQAVGGFGAVVAQGADLEGLKNALGGVTGGLSTAFETTLIALIAALLIQLLMTLLIQKEEAFLDEAAQFCHKNVTSKLKMVNVDLKYDSADMED